RSTGPAARAARLTRHGELLGTLEKSSEAAEAFEAALEAVPGSPDAIAGLKALRDAEGDWPGVLECMDREFSITPSDRPETRASILHEAAALAEEHVGRDAALPWLERLRRIFPTDSSVLGRIADAHRAAGRTVPLMYALEDELELEISDERRIEIHLERAHLYEDELSTPARSADALESARQIDPSAPAVLEALDTLYAAQGRAALRLPVVEARLEQAEGTDTLGLHRSAAALSRELDQRDECVSHLWRALPAADGSERVDLLRELGDEMSVAGRRDLWARLAEAELAALDPDAPVFEERRQTLCLDLARAYMDDLGAWDAALPRLRQLAASDLGPDRQRETRERLLQLLRRSGDSVELESRLSAHLADASDSDAEDWLELAQLRHEKLHRPAAAALAYREVLARSETDLTALRGLRTTAARLGRAEEVAECLERELELRPDADAHERGPIWRRLGDVAWKQLDETPRASRAFAAALEADPNDLEALRSLEVLFETMEDWRGACDLYESEVSVLGEEEPERRQTTWLRAGELARDELDDAPRALRAYEAAFEIDTLDLARQHEWSELYQKTGDDVRFCEVFAAWLDADDSPARAGDHARLAQVLESLGRLNDAKKRAACATDLDPSDVEAWDLLADIAERLGEAEASAEALDQGAALREGRPAAERRLRAARMLGDARDELCVELLTRAVANDPALREAHAELALVSSRLGRVADAETAAGHALALEDDGASTVPESLRLEAALAGARAAESQDHLESSVRLLQAALDVTPGHAEALSAMGRTLSRLGDSEGARNALSQCLDLEFSDRDRALHLTLLAEAEEAAGRTEDALEHFREAITLDAERDETHAGLTRSLVRTERREEAIEALQAWALRAEDEGDRASRLLQAAELELERPSGEGAAAAESLLDAAVAAAPETVTAWVLLCQLQWSQGRVEELVDTTGRALEQTLDGPTHARLSLLRGRALEQRGAADDAAVAFQSACEADPRCAEGALSAARLRRSLGEWQDAANVLQRFVERAPEDATRLAAPALHQLGRLLAGPLEDVEGAIAVYRGALESDPELEEAQDALADLLVHRSAHWDEAADRHRELLARNPARLASLRGLLRIARGRENPDRIAAGLSILRALGVATPDERIEAPARPPQASGARPSLGDPLSEAIRRAAA
ncbi:MAG: tetratricopeptide repeat protein, partial [Myxococcota bacterium]